MSQTISETRRNVSTILLLVLLITAVVAWRITFTLYGESKELQGQLQEQLAQTRQEKETLEVKELLEDLCLFPEAVHMDTAFMLEVREARQRLYQRNNLQQVIDGRQLVESTARWQGSKGPWFNLVDADVRVFFSRLAA